MLCWASTTPRPSPIPNFFQSSSLCPLPPLQDQYNTIAKFLEAKGMPEEALEVATDAGE